MNEKTIYALGFFDGVHLGHQALLTRCQDLAGQMHCAAGVVTFQNHPDALVSGQAPALLCSQEDRARLLGHYGVEKRVELPFDQALMELPWQDFIPLLVEKYGAAGLVCGQDFRFGYRGEGTAELLAQACVQGGLAAAVVPEQTLDGIRISSSQVRSLLSQGQVEQACRFLGHPHILSGKVVPGRQLGRTIGIPTANVQPQSGVLLPKGGVYACRVYVDGHVYPAVTNIGTRPTVGGHKQTLEAWLLDFSGDLYGKTLTLSFHAYLRPEKAFPSLTDLQTEIQKNALQTRKILEKT